MIQRRNWLHVKAYLKYLGEVEQLSADSVAIEEKRLRHLLEWAGDTLFESAPKIRPTLPDYLLTVRRDGEDGTLSPAYVKRLIRSARRFFRWVKRHRRGYSDITEAWLDTLKAPRMASSSKKRKAVSLDHVRAIAEAPVEGLREQRIQAAAVFWFLSGIRIGAFVTLPLLAVDLAGLMVKQWPELGVRTKFKKHATTYLLNIPDLLEVVARWDRFLRAHLPDTGYWFAPLVPVTGKLDVAADDVGNHRHVRARKDLRRWSKKVGLPYYSPHKFRHGHAVYAIKQAGDLGDLKAISQNLMHSNLSITDGVYGILSGGDVKERIGALGNGGSDLASFDKGQLKAAFEAWLNSL